MRTLALIGATLLNHTQGWDTNGHWVVSLLAGSLLTDRAEKFIRANIATKAQDIPRSMAYASIWADLPDPAFAWSKDLHFAYSDQASNCSPYEEARDCPNGRCLITALANYTMRAADYSLSAVERNIAVKFLLHFMAEIHQPMHLGFRADVGGTKLWINSAQTTLHNVWDQTLFEHHLEQNEKQNTHRLWNYYAVFEDLMSDLQASLGPNKVFKRMFTSEDISSKQTLLTKIESIATETSSRLTCNIAYKHVDGTSIWNNDDLDDDYMKSRSGYMLKQFQRAGIRLAHILDVVAEEYFKQRDAACEAKRQEDMKKQAKSSQSSNTRFANAFESLNGGDCASDDEESTIDSLTEEDILQVEKTIMFPPASNKTAAKASKKKQQKGKSADAMNYSEFDALMRQYAAENAAESSKASADSENPVIAVVKKKKLKKANKSKASEI